MIEPGKKRHGHNMSWLIMYIVTWARLFPVHHLMFNLILSFLSWCLSVAHIMLLYSSSILSCSQHFINSPSYCLDHNTMYVFIISFLIGSYHFLVEHSISYLSMSYFQTLTSFFTWSYLAVVDQFTLLFYSTLQATTPTEVPFLSTVLSRMFGEVILFTTLGNHVHLCGP